MATVFWTLVSALTLLGLWTAVDHLRRFRWGLALRGTRHAGLSVLLVIRDQAEGLEALLRDLLEPEAGGWQPVLPYEVVAVDAGSRDESRPILLRLARHDSGLRVLTRAPDDAASDEDVLRLGMRLCRNPVVVICDLRSPGAATSVRPLLAALLGGIRPVGVAAGHDRAGPRPSVAESGWAPDR